MRSLPMIARSVRVDPNRSETMSVEAKTAIIEHLGRQHQAMVDLLADLVNIDSSSYNKRGVDAVGDRLRVRLEAGFPLRDLPERNFWRSHRGGFPLPAAALEECRYDESGGIVDCRAVSV